MNLRIKNVFMLNEVERSKTSQSKEGKRKTKTVKTEVV